MSSAPLFSRLDTVILRVRDVVAARRWYAETFGLEVVHSDDTERLAVLALEGASLTLWELKPGEQAATGARAFPIFAVADAGAAHAQLRDRGVAVEPLQSGAGVCFFGFVDPDGNRMEACQLLDG